VTKKEAINERKIVKRRTNCEQPDRHIESWEEEGTHRRCPLVLLITIA